MVCIPFVIEGILETNHITVMLIKDGVVGYYDSKGVKSEFCALEGGTLRDIIEFCRDCLSLSGDIVENFETMQWDINTCGLHVARYVYAGVCEGRAVVDLVSQENINQFRQTFYDTAKFAFIHK